MNESTNELVRRLAQFEHRVAKVEAIEEIRRLKGAYAAACDAGYHPDDMRQLFTEDAVWATERFGTFTGIEEIAAFFDGVSAQITWARHFMIGHEVEVDDDLTTASGKCQLLEPCVMDGAMVLLSGSYVDRYRKVDGEWLMENVHLTLEDVGLLPHVTPAGAEADPNAWTADAVVAADGPVAGLRLSSSEAEVVSQILNLFTAGSGDVGRMLGSSPIGSPAPLTTVERPVAVTQGGGQ